MYNVLLTDDPSNWPWHAFVHLPMIPFSLILSRTRLFDTFPLVPLFLTWSSSPPVRTTSSSAAGASSTSRASRWMWPRDGPQPYYAPALSWPPTPLMAMVLLPFVRSAYRVLFARLTRYVMGVQPDAAGAGAAPGAAAGPIRRVIWALNGDGPAPLRVQIGANIQQVGGPNAQRRNNGNGNGNGNAANANANGGGDGDGDGDAPDDPAAVAERTLHVTTSSVGRFIGGALLIPTISSRMGSLLYRLSKHSALLRAFLAIKERPAGVPSPMRLFTPGVGAGVGQGAGMLQQVGAGLVAGINVMCGGTPAWNAQDPVGWRNAVGLGVFVFVSRLGGFRVLERES